jgi:CheY-like chemotaxis protein
MIGTNLNSNTNRVSKIKNKKILSVDSSKRIRDALSLFFKLEECNFLAVETPETALKLLQKETYDIIIADYYFPGLNGLEFLNYVKSKFPKMMGILTVSSAERKVIEQAKEAGIREVVLKPFSAMTLVLRIQQIFEKGFAKLEDTV